MRSILCLMVCIPLFTVGQIHPQPSAAKIKLELKKLNFLGSVLYVAAHPDDENTKIITYMANEQLAETAYLSMTRGDGGQNLIGSELRDLLGLIRTQELLSARRIDGGKQFFTRANDFGFSKSADETFKIWGKEEILSDVIRVYRQYQPDVIITRFPPDERAGHGHHTASAMLAQEAFDSAIKTEVYPNLAKQFGTWQPHAIYTNTGRWWNNTITDQTPGIITIDVGKYSALLGTSYSEIAAISRSQHKSQGFGSSGTRGYQPEFLEFIKGEKATKDVFDNINTTWSRVKGSQKIQPLVDKVIKEFDVEKPANSIPSLFQLRKEISLLEEGVWKQRKLAEVQQLIIDCAGLYISITADRYWIAPNEHVTTNFEFTNRSSADIHVEHIQSDVLAMDSTLSLSLIENKAITFKTRKPISAKAYTDPYWLKAKHSTGIFTVSDPSLIGKPENDPSINTMITLKIGVENIQLSVPVIYKENDPVKGETTRPVEIVPPLFLNLADPVLVFKDESPREVRVLVKSSSESAVKGNIKLLLPEGWRCEPQSIPFELAVRGDEEAKNFMVYPSRLEITSSLKAIAEVNGQQYDQSLQLISYDHIPAQTLLPKAEAKVVQLDLKKKGGIIGYIKGAGDEIPASLRNMGYQVWEMKNEEVTVENLKRVDAVVLGIRAVNTNDRMRYLMPRLLEYVKEGGTMVVQYNINNNLSTETFSPYPITLSRDRVTEEDAEVRILKPDHPLLNYPNKITPKDIDGWVQERGLYFPDKWDANYQAILSMNDKGETPKDGSLLVANYGNGHYVYTGLSFFRELPEGVAGAYKLFANIVSLKTAKPENAKVKRKNR